MTRISVLLPVFDAAEVIGQAIENILAQSVVPDEIVVIDDGSRDGLQERLARLTGRCQELGVALVRAGFPTNRGRGAARNLALQTASGEFVTWYDVDDLWDPAKLAVQKQAYGRLQLAHPADRLLLTCNYLRYAGDRSKPVAAAPTLTIENLISVRLRRHVQLQTVFGPRETFVRAGGFDPDLNRVEDFDFALRFAAAGGKFVNADPDGPPLVHYFRNPANAGPEAKAANQRVIEKSRRIFRVGHVDPDEFLAAKFSTMQRFGRSDALADAAMTPVNPGPAGAADLTVRPDGALAIGREAEGNYIARDAEMREVGSGRFRGSWSVIISQAEIVRLFLAGARTLDITVARRPAGSTSRLRVLRDASGLISVAP